MTAQLITPADAFAAALRGSPCCVHGLGHAPTAVPANRWRLDADAGDRALLSRCQGATVDIGCGPGRMTYALMRQGVKAMGIDVVDEAVRQARERGAPALLRDVFGRLPGEGRWETALLADGNIGIGGDPVRLLRRVHDVIARDGRVVVDLAEPGRPGDAAPHRARGGGPTLACVPLGARPGRPDRARWPRPRACACSR